MKHLFYQLFICLIGISAVHAQMPSNKKIYIKGTADARTELTLSLRSELLAEPGTKSIATDEEEQEFILSYDIYGYGEYFLKWGEEQIAFYAEPNDTIQVSCKNKRLVYVSSSNLNGEVYQQLRESFPSYAVAVTGKPGPEVLTLAKTLEEDREKREEALEKLIKQNNLSESYINFERNQSYYTAAMLNMMYKAYVKPRYFEYEPKTGSTAFDGIGCKKLIKKILPEYSLKSPYPEAIHSESYHKYLRFMYIFSSPGYTDLPTPRGNAAQAMKALTKEHYDEQGAQVLIYYTLAYATSNTKVYDMLYGQLHTAITIPLLKDKLKVSDQKMMENKEKNKVTKSLPKPLIVTDDLAKKKDFNAYFSQFDGKTVYLDIWATWCRGCIAQFDAGKLLHHKIMAEGYGDEVAFVSFCVKVEDDGIDNWKQVIDKFQLSGIHLRKSSYLTINLDFKVREFPTYAIRKPNGTWVLADSPRGRAYEQIVEAVAGGE